MGRIRTIKPEFFLDEELFDAEQETGLPIRVAFAGLWTCCDREGRFQWKPRQLKTQILPYDNSDFSRVLDALVTRGFIVKYASQGESFGAVRTWKKHQFINNREPKSSLPSPESTTLKQQQNQCVDASSTREPRDDYATATDVVKEGKGKEGKGRDTRVDDAPPLEPLTLDSDPMSEVPEGLTDFNYADAIMEAMCWPKRSMYSVHVALVDALPILASDEGCSLGEACRRMYTRIREAEAGTKGVKWRFWIGEEQAWKQCELQALSTEGME